MGGKYILQAIISLNVVVGRTNINEMHNMSSLLAKVPVYGILLRMALKSQ